MTHDRLSEIAKILGSRGGKIGGSKRNKNRTRESYQEAGRKGGLQKGINAKQRHIQK